MKKEEPLAPTPTPRALAIDYEGEQRLTWDRSAGQLVWWVGKRDCIDGKRDCIYLLQESVHVWDPTGSCYLSLRVKEWIVRDGKPYHPDVPTLSLPSPIAACLLRMIHGATWEAAIRGNFFLFH